MFNFVKFVATRNGMKTNFLLLFLDPGWEKIRIRDKHPGSATLVRVIIVFIAPIYYFIDDNLDQPM
jgi:hypothetical protein